jgi:2'-5' RNA ligase
MKFSIVRYLDESTTNKVRTIQNTISQLTGSGAVLVSWFPHITLGDGIITNGNQERRNFLSDMQVMCQTMRPFSVAISGFGQMDNWSGGIGKRASPYVLYIKISIDNELLNAVNKIGAITLRYPKCYHMPHPYLPHVTVAFRDLTKQGFDLGLNYLKNQEINDSSKIDHVALVEKLPDSDVERIRFSLYN